MEFYLAKTVLTIHILQNVNTYMIEVHCLSLVTDAH
jgi:hypothetical protein